MKTNLLVKVLSPYPLVLLLFYFSFVWNIWIWDWLDHSLVGYELIRTFLLYIFKGLEYLLGLCFSKFTLLPLILVPETSTWCSQKRTRVCTRLCAEMPLLYPYQAVITLNLLLLPEWNSVLGSLQGYIVISYGSCSTR